MKLVALLGDVGVVPQVTVGATRSMVTEFAC